MYIAFYTYVKFPLYLCMFWARQCMNMTFKVALKYSRVNCYSTFLRGN
jgi:hypothetical protein